MLISGPDDGLQLDIKKPSGHPNPEGFLFSDIFSFIALAPLAQKAGNNAG